MDCAGLISVSFAVVRPMVLGRSLSLKRLQGFFSYLPEPTNSKLWYGD